jgi:hypothetical protein
VQTKRRQTVDEWIQSDKVAGLVTLVCARRPFALQQTLEQAALSRPLPEVGPHLEGQCRCNELLPMGLGISRAIQM